MGRMIRTENMVSWNSFSDCSGPGREWIMAYVACALSATVCMRVHVCVCNVCVPHKFGSFVFRSRCCKPMNLTIMCSFATLQRGLSVHLRG